MQTVSMAATEPEGNRDRVMSLPQLQNLMKRDPEAYGPEFDQQWSHFESQMEIFKLKPQKPQSSFHEQVMFLAHVAPSFPTKGAAFPGLLIGALNEHYEVMHSQMRQVLVQALILLRNRDQFPCIRTLPLYFKLFSLQDKNLRQMTFMHIVRDIAQMNLKTHKQKENTELRDFFFSRLQDTDVEVARRACAAFISFYRQNVWRDAHVTNLMSAGLLHPDVKIAAALAHLFLGNKTKGLEGILDESDDEGDAEQSEVVRGVVGVKKTKKREKKIQRAKRAVKKATKKGGDASSSAVSFAAIDLLHDPQTLAERLLQRVSKGGEPFLFRLLLLHLIARLVGRHQLQLLNLYPFFLKYMNPTQREVTKVLACLVEASHAQVAPDELKPVILHVLREFVTEGQASEVIEVGLNAIREVCSRAVNVITEEELGDLAEFRRYKNKGVAMAARSLINVYRELHPQLLHRSLRGREATMALSRGEVATPEYGRQEVREAIDGLELLAGKRSRRAQDGDGDDGDEATQDASAKAESAIDAKQLMAEQVLSSDDFQKLRKLRLQRSVERQLGRKRKQEEMSSSSSESEDEEGSQGSDDERGLSGRMPGSMSAAELKATPSKNRTKAGRLAKVKEGRTDIKAKIVEEKKARRGGKTNAEKRRNKPLMMALQSKHVKKKLSRNASQKMTNMKKHIKTLRSNVNHQKRRR